MADRDRDREVARTAGKGTGLTCVAPLSGDAGFAVDAEFEVGNGLGRFS